MLTLHCCLFTHMLKLNRKLYSQLSNTSILPFCLLSLEYWNNFCFKLGFMFIPSFLTCLIDFISSVCYIPEVKCLKEFNGAVKNTASSVFGLIRILYAAFLPLYLWMLHFCPFISKQSLIAMARVSNLYNLFHKG